MITLDKFSNDNFNLDLGKGFSLELRKNGINLNKITLAAGWDVAKTNPPYDLDLFAFCYRKNSIRSANDIVFFNNKEIPGIILPIDNTTGAGDGDDETIEFELDKIDSGIDRIRIFVNIFEAQKRNQNFGAIRNAYVRLLNREQNDNEEVRFNLTQDYSIHTAVCIGDLIRKNNNWELLTIGEGEVGDINTLANKYQTIV